MPATAPVAHPGLDRVSQLSGVDHGFYLLAIHAFIEGHVKGKFPGRVFSEYRDVARAFVEEMCAPGGGFQPLSMTNRLVYSHGLANKVRHEFAGVEEAFAKATTAEFVQCLRQAGLGTEGQRQKLSNLLQEWNERKPPSEAHQLLKRQERELAELRKQAAAMTGEVEAYQKLRRDMEALQLRMRQTDLEMEQVKKTAAARKENEDRLRGERGAQDLQMKALMAEKAKYNTLEKYLELLGKFSAYSRSRMDYERNLKRLAPEQEMVLRKIKPGDDVLIKGGAGTGKSLVLIHAMKKTLGHAGLLSWADGSLNLLFLTYTNVLVKYDQYLSDTLSESRHEVGFRTVDSFLQDHLLPVLVPGVQIRFGKNAFLPDLLAACPLEKPLEPRALESELENFLFSQCVTREEYLEEGIERKGMVRALQKREREKVWAIRDWVVDQMGQKGIVTRMYGRWLMLKALEEKGFPSSLQRPDIIFIDEVQDLTALDLRLLKAVSSRCLVMAGDFDQTIFAPASPFLRAGLNLGGKTHLLKANFRNTLAVGALAEAYRSRAPGAGPDRETVPMIFREGPRPERFKAPHVNGLLDLMVSRVKIYTEELGYDPGSIAVLTFSNKDLEEASGFLTRAGLETMNLREEGFQFTDFNKIRLTTLHSSKGLDFPVVLLYLPKLERFGFYEASHADRMLHNLVYVSLTRATDNLNVFLLDKPEHPALVTLDRVFDETEAGSEGGAGHAVRP